MFRPAALALTTIAALALPACGDTSDADHVRKTATAWLKDVSAGNGAAACARLTPHARRFVADQSASVLDPMTCEQVIERVAATLTPAERRALPRLVIHRVVFAENHRKAIIFDADVTLSPDIEPDGNDRPTVLRRDAHGAWQIEDLG